MSDLFGCWNLRRYLHAVDTVSSDDDPSQVQAWLWGADDRSLDGASEQTGLQILVRDDSFSERVMEFSSLMFDVEGIQVNDYQPMSGKMLIIDRIGFLIPDGVPDYALSDLSDPGQCALRYDDDDTKICDTIRVSGDSLVRQISVVTDELYLDRMTLEYCRSSDYY